MAEYLIYIVGAKPPNRDPYFDEKYIDKNPFGFKRKGVGWKWVSSGYGSFSLSPEIPGLQVEFHNKVSKKLQKETLAYIQSGIKENVEILQLQS